MCDRVAVMYLGKIVEIGPRRRALRLPAPPLHRRVAGGRASRGPSRHGAQRRLLSGDVPSPANPPKAAASTRAARRRRSAARSRSRCSSRMRAARRWRATSRSSARSSAEARSADQRMSAESPAREAQELLRALIRFNTVNPPGSERAAQEYLAAHLSDAGFACELLGAEPQRPNLIARLRAGERCPARADAVLPRTRRHRARRPRRVAPRSLVGRDRGGLRVGSRRARHEVAGRRRGRRGGTLARSGWRPARGELMLVAVVDEETGGELGAKWLCETHPEKVRCDLLINEGGGAAFEYGGRRRYGVCCAEKGVFRFTLTTDGVAGHASMPGMGENALLKMGPVLERFAARQPSYSATEEARAFLRGIGEDPEDLEGSIARAARRRSRPGDLLRAAARRHLHAHSDPRVGEDQRHPQPRRAARRLPRAARPRRGRGARRACARCSARRARATAGGSSSPSRSSATARPSARR